MRGMGGRSGRLRVLGRLCWSVKRGRFSGGDAEECACVCVSLGTIGIWEGCVV